MQNAVGGHSIVSTAPNCPTVGSLCNGYTAGIYAGGHKNVTIKNGTINNFVYDILLLNSQDSMVTQVNAVQNYFAQNTGRAVELVYSTNIRVIDNDLGRNQVGVGIF